MEATVHWHGLRLENRFDGTHETQEAIPVGGRYSARVAFPDPGIYWYHPHIREDNNQEMGLYGNVVVVPPDPDYWPPVHRELALTLDDVLIADGQVAAFSRDETTYSAMGRFGKRPAGRRGAQLALTALAGEVVRLYLTNTASTRVFKVALPGAHMFGDGTPGGLAHAFPDGSAGRRHARQRDALAGTPVWHGWPEATFADHPPSYPLGVI